MECSKSNDQPNVKLFESKKKKEETISMVVCE